MTTTEAAEVVAGTREHAARRDEQTRRVDYDALNRMVRRQRAALTRAIKTGDPGPVVLAARDAVREWNQPGAMWPDDWSRWQRAVDDALGFGHSVDIADLR